MVKRVCMPNISGFDVYAEMARSDQRRWEERFEERQSEKKGKKEKKKSQEVRKRNGSGFRFN